jgi:hypothetical protein
MMRVMHPLRRMRWPRRPCARQWAQLPRLPSVLPLRLLAAVCSIGQSRSHNSNHTRTSDSSRCNNNSSSSQYSSLPQRLC